MQAEPVSTETAVLTEPPAMKRRIPWPSGRMGRVRYISIVLGLVVLYSAILSAIGVILSVAGVAPPIAERTMQLFSGVLFFPLMAAILFWSIERVHDAGWSGWLALLVFVPYLNLLFWVWPGKPDSNAFGPKPAPTSLALRVLVTIVVAILVLTYAMTLWRGPMVPETTRASNVELPAYQE